MNFATWNLNTIKNKLFATILVTLLMGVLVAGALPAYAANTPVNGTTLTFYKHLVVESEANIPPVTFSYTIAAGTAEDGVTNGIYPGPMSGTTVPSVTSAAFSVSDTTTPGKPGDASGSPTAGFKYASKNVTINLTGVSFTAPGVYRYVITEASNNASVLADSAKRYLDVLVVYDDTAGTSNTLKVDSVALYKAGESDKTNSFISELTTYNLTLKKEVTGNQGDREKYFEFTVTITGAVADTAYPVDLSRAESSPTVGQTTETNPATITVGENGSVTATYYLKHDQSIVIQGLASGTGYSITETDSSDGYTTSNTDNTGSGADGKVTGNQTITADHAVTFTNHKEGTVPTGIILETAPYMVLVLATVAALILLVVTRKRHSR